MNKLTAIGDRVIVNITAEAEKLKSGLILPTKGVEKPNTGVIVSLGDEIDNPRLHEGSTIIFDKFAGLPVISGDDNTVAIKHKDIIAVMNL